jgi:hypothetical protein
VVERFAVDEGSGRNEGVHARTARQEIGETEITMKDNEKRLRYEAQIKLGQMERDGAKPSTIERLRRSIAGVREHQQKGKVFGPKNKGF